MDAQFEITCLRSKVAELEAELARLREPRTGEWIRGCAERLKYLEPGLTESGIAAVIANMAPATAPAAASPTVEAAVDAWINGLRDVGWGMISLTEARESLLRHLSTLQPGPASQPEVEKLRAENDDLKSRIHEQNEQYCDAMFPVYQVCEACAPSVLDETGTCPKCKQTYDYSRWMKMSAKLKSLESQLSASQSRAGESATLKHQEIAKSVKQAVDQAAAEVYGEPDETPGEKPSEPWSQCQAINGPPPQTWDDYEKGCHLTFGGGYQEELQLKIFHHGMSTIFNLLRKEFPSPTECRANADEITRLRTQLADIERATVERAVKVCRDYSESCTKNSPYYFTSQVLAAEIRALLPAQPETKPAACEHHEIDQQRNQ